MAVVCTGDPATFEDPVRMTDTAQVREFTSRSPRIACCFDAPIERRNRPYLPRDLMSARPCGVIWDINSSTILGLKRVFKGNDCSI